MEILGAPSRAVCREHLRCRSSNILVFCCTLGHSNLIRRDDGSLSLANVHIINLLISSECSHPSTEDLVVFQG